MFGCFALFCCVLCSSNLWYLDDCHYTKGVDGMSMNVDKSGLLMYMPIK